MLDGSRELGLVIGLMKAMNERNVEAFEQVAFLHNKISPLDKLETKVLLKI